MPITLVQGLLLALVAFICGAEAVLEAFFWFRPIVVGFLAGIVLGDVALGCKCGAVAELSYMGLTTVGGTVPPNPLMAGMMTVVLAYTLKLDPATALGLSLPFALLAQWMSIIFNTTFALYLPAFDKAAEEANVARFTALLMSAWFIVAIMYALLTFVSAYAFQAQIQAFVTSFPEWLIRGFEIAGGVMPAVGLTLLMVVMVRMSNIGYLFIGFVIATLNGAIGGLYEALGGGYEANIIPVAIAGACFALFSYLNDQKETSTGGSDDGGI